MSFDFFAESQFDRAENQKMKKPAKIKLLTKKLSGGEKDKTVGYKELLGDQMTYREFMLGVVDEVAMPRLDLLSTRAAFLQFTFTLATPHLSRDDEIFHILDNPVRKDKVFKVPLISGSGWKGNLRWTAMKIHLEPKKDDLDEFINRRVRHTLWFGSEKGFETGEHTGWAQFLDHRCDRDKGHYEKCKDNREEAHCRAAREGYQQKLRELYQAEETEALPHQAGWLRFYPTFFSPAPGQKDCLALEVINPHDRRTRAGTKPIFFESVAKGAQGTFSLLYLPFAKVTDTEARTDLRAIAAAIAAMMLFYGFSAKKSSGYGEAEDAITGRIVTTAGEKTLARLSTLAEEVGHVEWR